MVTTSPLARLEAPPGREAALAELPVQARSIVMEEPRATARSAPHLAPSTSGVVDVVPDDEARDAPQHPA